MSNASSQSDTSMQMEFDPYHKWLAISPREQPPNHYRLLAVDLFETDLDVIEAAALARSTFVRQCATGPHAEASQQVLNDLSAAQICLLNPDSKAEYDARLKAEMAAAKQEEAEQPGRSSETVSTGRQAVDPKRTQLNRKLDKQKKQIEVLLEKCEFAAAISALEKMAAVKHPQAAKYVKWAKQQLPKAKSGTDNMRESTAAMYRTAADLVDRNDYEEAAEILQQIPQKYRSREISGLLQDCLDLQEEVTALQEDIERAESLKKYDDLQPTVERLLEIKPNDRRARKLLKELKTYGKGGGMRLGGRGDKRFDAAGNTSNPLKVALFVVIPLVLFAVVGYATVVYVRSNDKTIKIEIDDPSAKVIIDGEAVKITGVGDTVKLKTGKHDLIVERGDLVVHTREFEVVKGKNPVLRITLEEMAETAGVPPPVAVTDDASSIFLTDLKATEIDVAYAFLPKPETPVKVNGITSPHGFHMHTKGNDPQSKVSYALNRRYKEFSGAFGILDRIEVEMTAAPITVKIIGDGRELYTSPPLQKRGSIANFNVDVSNVNNLLITAKSKSNDHAHVSCVEPLLSQKGGQSGGTAPSPNSGKFASVRMPGVKPQPVKPGMPSWNPEHPFTTFPEVVSTGFQYLQGGNVSGNTSQFEVLSDGIVYLVLSGRPGGGGNSSGGWKEKIISPQELAAAGWKPVGKIGIKELAQPTIYERFCKKGESFTYSWEKYVAPALIVPTGSSTSSSAPAGNATYLADLKPTDVKIIGGFLASEDNPVTVNGVNSRHGFHLHPQNNGRGSVTFALNRKYQRVSGAFGVRDDLKTGSGTTTTPVTFKILGDGKVLYTSPPLQKWGSTADFNVDVSQVNVLQMTSETKDGYRAWVACVEPRLHHDSSGTAAPTPTIIKPVSTRQAAEWVLGLGGTITTDAGTFKTVDELPQQPFEISHVVLSHKQVTDDGLANLRGLKNLTDLRLQNTQIGDAGVTHLKGLTNLITLTLSGTQISDAGLANFQGMTDLVTLHLDTTPINGEGLKHLQGITGLAALRLERTQVNDSSLAHLKDMTSLTDLRLGYTQVSDAGLVHLKGLKNLKTLTLDETQISDAGLANLQDMTNLLTLHALSTPIRGQGLKHLQGMAGLAALRLERTQVDDSSLVHLKDMTSLTDLRLAHTRISDAGLVHLKGLTNLKTLNIEGTQVSDAGLVNLQAMKKLISLHAVNTPIRGEGLKHLQGIAGLAALRLEGTQVDDSGLSHLKKVTSLIDLRLAHTKVTANGVADLQKTLPKCKITH